MQGAAPARLVHEAILSLCWEAVFVQILVPCVVGGYMQGAAPARLVHEAILSLCRELKDDAVSLVDVIAPPDFILNSPIGKSDGQVSHLIPSNAEATFIQSTRTQKFQKTIWTLLCGYSLESSCWALSYEYPFARFSVNFSGFLHHFVFAKLATSRIRVM